MAVDAERDCDRGVTETLLNDSGMDALFEGQGRPGVAKTMKSDPPQPVVLDTSDEHPAHGFGAKASAVGLMEHQSLVGEVRTDEQPFFEHRLAVVSEHGDGRRVERDGPSAARRLRFSDG